MRHASWHRQGARPRDEDMVLETMRVVRFIAWVAVVLLCSVAFVRTGSALLLGIVITAIVMPLVGWLGVVFASREVDVDLASHTSATKGAAIALQVKFANGSRVPVPTARAIVYVRNLLTGEVADLPVSAPLSPRSNVTVPVELSSELCGRVECSVDRVQLFELFRLFSRTIECPAERRLTVMPDLHEARLRDVYAASPLSDTTVFSPYVRGSDLSETFGLREYEQGDELKRIHWKLSEKIDKMIVRDASLPLDNALMLFWDKRVSENASDVALAADTMAEVVLALMEQMVQAGVAFEISSNDIPASRCTRAFVTDENDIYEVIGQLLSAPFAPAAESGLAEYVRFYGDLTCSRLLYVCAERPYNLENLIGQREAVLLVCDGGSDMTARGQVAEVHFPPGDARVALDMMGAM